MGLQLPGIGHGQQLIERTAIVRLGPGGPILHLESNHAALGITGLEATSDGYLTVYSDFGPDEDCLSVTANVDLTLARKEVYVGASGGGAVTKFGIYSPQYGRTPGGVLLKIPADSPFFDPSVDNLWIRFLSARPAE